MAMKFSNFNFNLHSHIGFQYFVCYQQFSETIIPNFLIDALLFFFGNIQFMLPQQIGKFVFTILFRLIIKIYYVSGKFLLFVKEMEQWILRE